jgi:hypothetical protein
MSVRDHAVFSARGIVNLRLPVYPRAGLWPLLAVVLLVAAGCSDPSWREVASPDGGFRIRMRGDPRVEQRNVDTPAGKITGHWYSLDGEDSVFGVGFADYPHQILQRTPSRNMFSGVRDSWLKRIGGQLDGNATDIKLDGKWVGMEFSARGKLDGRDAWMRGRLYLVDNRLYQLIVFGNKETIPVSDINQFMGSFKVAQPKESTTLTIDAAPDKKK